METIKRKKGKGRPRIKPSEKVKVVSAYLKKSDEKKIVEKYGNVTLAIKTEILPLLQCG